MTKYQTSNLKGRDISCVSWLAGSWKGKVKGDYVEEYWAQPLGETMMGMFRWIRDGKVRMYELLSIEATAERLVYRVKHFSSELKGWEEKDRAVELNLVEFSKDPLNKVVFLEQGKEDLTWGVYMQTGMDSFEAYFEKEEELLREDQKFTYSRNAAKL